MTFIYKLPRIIQTTRTLNWVLDKKNKKNYTLRLFDDIKEHKALIKMAEYTNLLVS